MERTEINMKAVELAASSPDPKVRNVALHRLELEEEIKPLDAFLDMYVNMSAAAPSTPVATAKAKNGNQEKKPAVDSSRNASKGKTERMVMAACGIIKESARPMAIGDIFDALSKRHPDLCPSSVPSMRARLTEFKSHIVRVDERGYWPTETPVPALP